MDIQSLPSVNASLNFCAFVLLLLGRWAILKGHRSLHVRFMLTAVGVSTLFLVCYTIYHVNTVAVTRFQGQGIMKWLYYFILMTHIPLAGILLPAVITVLQFAFRGRWDSHRKWARRVCPMWMYVSVTGVLIYVFLYLIPVS